MLQVVHNLFNHPGLRKLFLRLRYPILIILVILLASIMKPQMLLTGFLISMFGEFIQVWSFASLVKNEELTARGPYVMVRNPMYLGRYFLVLGVIVLPGNIYIVVIYTLFYYFYMVNRVKREESRLAKLLGQPYQDYCQRTNPFWPTFSRLFNKEVWFWSWRVCFMNNGHWNFLSAIIVWATIYVYLNDFFSLFGS